MSTKPNQTAVDEWMRALYQHAHDNQHRPPKRKEEAFPACRAAIGATDVQMRQTMWAVPEEQKNHRGRVSNRRSKPEV